MKRKWILISLGIIILVVFIFVAGFRLFLFWAFYQDPDDANNLSLMDSIKLNDNLNLYWYNQATNIGHSSTTYMRIANTFCGSDKHNANISGDWIFGIDTIKTDTIIILSVDTFTVMKSIKDYIFIREIPPDNKVLRKTIFNKEVPYQDICK